MLCRSRNPIVKHALRSSGLCVYLARCSVCVSFCGAHSGSLFPNASRARPLNVRQTADRATRLERCKPRTSKSKHATSFAPITQPSRRTQTPGGRNARCTKHLREPAFPTGSGTFRLPPRITSWSASKIQKWADMVMQPGDLNENRSPV